MANSMIFVQNSTSSSVAVGGTIPLGNAVHGFGCGINFANNAITLSPGYYFVNVSAIASASAAGNVTASLYVNGNNTNNESSFTAAAADDLGTLSINGVIRVPCHSTATLTLVLSDTAATITNLSCEVIKIR